MKLTPSLLALTVTSLLSQACSTGSTRGPASEPGQDSYLWLEDIQAERSLTWVKAHNQKTLGELQATESYRAREAEIRKITLAKDRLPAPSLMQGMIYNHWQDEKNVKGLWRRTTLSEFKKSAPKWETLLDLDALSQSENENWVWKGATCLPPSYERCLLRLSRAGKDAVVVREWSLRTREFITDGFVLPEAKTKASWFDEDHLFVGTDFGSDSMTDSGYPRIVKLWKRGTSLSDAKTIFEGEKKDVSVGGYRDFRPEGAHFFVTRSLSFYDYENYLLDPKTYKLEKIEMPTNAVFMGVFQGKLFYMIKSDLKLADGSTATSGSIVYGEVSPQPQMQLFFAPNDRQSVEDVSFNKDYIYLSTLDNVRGRISRFEWNSRRNQWASKQLSLPDNSEVSVLSLEDETNDALISYSNFLEPQTVMHVQGANGLNKLKQAPTRFENKGLVVKQFQATSKDGTLIPYFVIQPKRLRGVTPTLLYGYGGFMSAMTPWYLGATGKVWLEKGGVYIVANIRGGSEFGPKWHQAALKANRQKAYDDFIAVAEDLIAKKITSPAHLAIHGGSNGGLLVGNVMVQRPELLGAVICEVPLLDMMRYHRLLAGASWMGEYGNPDIPEEAAYLIRYSPYHQVRAGVKMPRTFFVTSTADDRVHPGHARKMVAKMVEQGHDVLLFENTEGGHSGAANLEQRVLKSALIYEFLSKQLGLAK